MSLSRALLQLDQFRIVSRDLTRGTFVGSAFTVLAYALLALILVAELGAYYRPSYNTRVVMDANENKLMTINFDVTMLDLPCKHLKLSIWDKFGTERVNTSESFHYIPVDHGGAYKGMAYTPEEIDYLEKLDNTHDVSIEEERDLNADWASSSDGFRHGDLNKAIAFHEFTAINFFAGWCIHCRRFSPVWNEFAAQHGDRTQFKDAGGILTTVHFLKVNCVDFSDACQGAEVSAFPTIRLYKKDGSFEPFKSKRTMEGIFDWITSAVGNSHLIVAQHHNQFNEGCQVQGMLFVPRVPGHFHLQAEAYGDVSLNPSMTNVSHSVNHISFGDRASKIFAESAKIPKEMLSHISPIDGKSFIVTRFHEASQHYLKVVSTQVKGRPEFFYQMTHTERVRRLKKDKSTAPQARFSYDFSPMSVVVEPANKRWYEFITSLFAILGGCYTIMQLCGGAVDTVHTSVKQALGKTN